MNVPCFSSLSHFSTFQLVLPGLLSKRTVRQRCVYRFLSFFKINLFIYLFLAVLGLPCCAWTFSGCGEWGLLFVAVCGLLIVVASLVVEHGLQARRLQQLQHVGSVVVAHGLQSAGSGVVVHGVSCSVACGIFLTRARTRVPCIARQILNHCATREVPADFLSSALRNDTCKAVRKAELGRGRN